MGRNTGKVVLLAVPCLVTLGLLIYCLASQSWVEIDETRLNALIETYEADFASYENRTGRSSSSRVNSLVGKLNATNKKTTTALTTTSSTTTTTTTTTTAITNQANDLDYTSDDYDDEATIDESAVASEHNQRKRRLAQNLFEKKSSKQLLKSATAMSAATTNEDVGGGGGWRKHGEFVYVTQLWPFVKRKGLYAECVDYRVMKLKMSVSYLIGERKVPIHGHIHYYDDAMFGRDAVSDLECAQKPGTIYCRFTKSCKQGKSCDGVADCEDQSDEQSCGESTNRVCLYANDIVGVNCDAKCYQYWHKCDGEPHCFDLSDELNAECDQQQHEQTLVNLTGANFFHKTVASLFPAIAGSVDPMRFTLGLDHYDSKHKCFQRYFNFKSAHLIPKDTLKYLTQAQADNIQETNNLNYHLQLISTMAFCAALLFCLLALLSLLFLSCFGKLCYQCPFWFFGFFELLAWATSLVGLLTFLYTFWADKQRALDPNASAMISPARAEIYRFNDGLVQIEKLGLAFWLATAAVGVSSFGSFLACIVCCRLPSSRHEDKEYKIMQLPTYS